MKEQNKQYEDLRKIINDYFKQQRKNLRVRLQAESEKANKEQRQILRKSCLEQLAETLKERIEKEYPGHIHGIYQKTRLPTNLSETDELLNKLGLIRYEQISLPFCGI